MRGKVRKFLFFRLILGITPAYAGKSSAFIRSSPVNQDHPRLCGEKCTFCHGKAVADGSPPPMRGKAENPCTPVNPCRITPAYAGKSTKLYQIHLPARDHPRLCGEKYSIYRREGIPYGSPPPMRGKEVLVACEESQRGITPAYAGKSSLLHHRFAFPKDHPRLCGEKLCCCRCDLRCQGSPPPMRGKGSSQSFKKSSTGITPAYAGKRVTCQVEILKGWDHPRLCGEKIAQLW